MTSINDYYYYPSKLSVTIMQGKEKCVVVVTFSHVFEPNSTKHARTVARVLCRRSAVNIGNNMISSAIWC